MHVSKNVLELRKKLGYSQDDVATKLGISRQTYLKFENNQCDLSTTQLQQIADFFGIQVSEFYYELQNLEKFKQMMIYILTKFKDNGIPKTKLAKLLYLSDFRHYYYNLESMSSVIYKCKEYGPLADPFLEMVDDMFEKGELHIDILSEGAQMLALSKSVNPKTNLLNDFEKKEIDEVCKKWKNATTQEVVNFTHNQKPWMACRPNEKIPYELILQEDPENVF